MDEEDSNDNKQNTEQKGVCVCEQKNVKQQSNKKQDGKKETHCKTRAKILSDRECEKNVQRKLGKRDDNDDKINAIRKRHTENDISTSDEKRGE